MLAHGNTLDPEQRWMELMEVRAEAYENTPYRTYPCQNRIYTTISMLRHNGAVYESSSSMCNVSHKSRTLTGLT